MYRIIIVILACVSLLGCASVPAKSDALNPGPKSGKVLESDVLTCRKGIFATWRASTSFVSDKDTIIVLCEYSIGYADDKIWSCIWDPKNNKHDCRYKQSVVQVAKEHIPSNPSDRYDLFCGSCVDGWK
jgi:hypothetical protein